MAIWSAQGTLVTKAKGQVSFRTNILKDGAQVEEFDGPDVSDISQVEPTIIARMKRLADLDVYDETKLDVITYDTDAKPDVPTAEQAAALAAQSAFVTNIQTYTGLMLMVKIGVLDAGDKSISTLKDVIQQTMLPEYMPLVARYSF